MKGSPAARRLRLNRSRRMAHGWPYCEHDGVERVVGTAADHVTQIRAQRFPPAAERGLVGGVEQAAAMTGPEVLIGVCPSCFCITWRDAPTHPREPVKGAAGRP